MVVKTKAFTPFVEHVCVTNPEIGEAIPQFRTVIIDVDKIVKCTVEGKWVLEVDVPIIVDEELNRQVDELQYYARNRGLPMVMCEAMGERVYNTFDRYAVAMKISELLK